MNDLPRHTLARIIADHGREICDAPKRVESLLRDLCGAHRREINIIVGALEERVAADLMAAGNSVLRDVLLARLAARLRDNLAYTSEAARWGVETWAFALGIMSETEFQARSLTKSAESERGDEQPPVPASKSPGDYPASANPQLPQTKSVTTYSPPQQSSQSPETSVQPPPIARTPLPAPPRTPTTTMPPNVAVPGPSPPHVSPSLPTRHPSRRGLTLRGCLIGVVLIVILIVAAIIIAPAIIMLLQEEQAQPGINEPRIR